MADPKDRPGVHLGEFKRWDAIFTVLRVTEDPPAFRVDYRDTGGGPSQVCTFTADPAVEPTWYRAWNGDEWCPWILAEARKIITNSTR